MKLFRNLRLIPTQEPKEILRNCLRQKYVLPLIRLCAQNIPKSLKFSPYLCNHPRLWCYEDSFEGKVQSSLKNMKKAFTKKSEALMEEKIKTPEAQQ